ncbi:hypothetical protein PGT21_022860 [Puccinia graminis f. sp. tritici]|uniref:Uncharacterized protein n=1 Tax=Puccinia graminis f. sp. tritici TaxID=56615 RepID=A0A5B0MN30_PUCGR|nr:hypothetical protein PGT21_022860 [Puccinia graminis f. sp. tritici]
MTAPFRYRRIKLILAVCCFQAIQCMHGDLPSSVLSQTYHKPPDVATSSTSRYILNSQVVGGGHHQMASEPEMKNPPTSEDDIKRYFNSVRQLRRPTTGLAREKLERATSQEEKQMKKSRIIVPDSPPTSSPTSSLSSIPSSVIAELDQLENQTLVEPKEGNLISATEWTPIATSNNRKKQKQKKRTLPCATEPTRYPEWTPDVSTYLNKPRKNKRKTRKKELKGLSPLFEALVSSNSLISYRKTELLSESLYILYILPSQ